MITIGVRMLSAGRTKVTLLTAKPANPAAPTAAELNAGIQICENIPASEFTFRSSGSETVDTSSLCSETKGQTFGQSNFELSFGLWRKYLVAGGIDATDDAAFAALKNKGVTIYLYMRMSDKKATTVWAVGDEIVLGAEAVTDVPVPMSTTEGFIGYTISASVVNGWPFITVV